MKLIFCSFLEGHHLFANHCGGADQKRSLCQSRLQCLHCLARGVRNGNPQYGQGVSSLGGARSGLCSASGIPTSSNHCLLSAKPQPVIARNSLTAVIRCSELMSRKRCSSSAADKLGDGRDPIGFTPSHKRLASTYAQPRPNRAVHSSPLRCPCMQQGSRQLHLHPSGIRYLP